MSGKSGTINNHGGKMNRQKVSFKGKIELEKVVSYLEKIIDGFSEGTIYLSNEKKSAILKPISPISIEIEASTKEKKEKIEITLSWSDGTKEEIAEPAFSILSSAPEPVLEESDGPNAENGENEVKE